MKSFIALILAMSLFTNVASADLVNCDFKQVKHNADGTMTYTKTLHICVGQLVYNQTIDNQIIDKLTAANKDLNLAVGNADAQAQIWKAEDVVLKTKIDEVKSQEKSNSWIYFGLGFLAASAAIYGASRITK